MSKPKTRAQILADLEKHATTKRRADDIEAKLETSSELADLPPSTRRLMAGAFAAFFGDPVGVELLSREVARTTMKATKEPEPAEE